MNTVYMYAVLNVLVLIRRYITIFDISMWLEFVSILYHCLNVSWYGDISMYCPISNGYIALKTYVLFKFGRVAWINTLLTHKSFLKLRNAWNIPSKHIHGSSLVQCPVDRLFWHIKQNLHFMLSRNI